MRRTILFAGSVVALSLIAANPTRADSNDFFNRAQKFFNNDNDRNAYERGRADQARRDEWQRERQAERWREPRETDRDYRSYNRDGD